MSEKVLPPPKLARVNHSRESGSEPLQKEPSEAILPTYMVALVFGCMLLKG